MSRILPKAFVHIIPFFADSRPEAIKRRKKWVDFVKAKRAKWEPTKHSAVCSVHFKPDDYVFQYVLVPTVRFGANTRQAFRAKAKKGQDRNCCFSDGSRD